MARLKVHTTGLLERLKSASIAYFFAKEDLGDNHATTQDALDKLKECAEHYAEERYPVPTDSEGNELDRPTIPINYERILQKLQAEFSRDSASLALGAKKTTGV